MGKNNYINSFKTSPNGFFHYYWWLVFLVIILLTIIFFIIFVILYYLKIKNKKQNLINQIQIFNDKYEIDLLENYNDDNYEYDEIGLPFLAKLGKLVYDYEMRNR